MNTGDILLLKEGTLGLGKGDNIGIYLGREKGGKQYIYTLFTLKGRQKVRQENVVRQLAGLAFKGNLKDDAAMRGYLLREVKPELKRREENRVKLSPEAIVKQVGIRDLWSSVVSFMEWGEEKRKAAQIDASPEDITSTGLSAQEIARIYFFPALPLEEHVAALRAILSMCEDAHYGYFRRQKKGKEERFIPYSRQEMTGVEEHIRRLNTLKGVFVEWREEEIQDNGTGRSNEAAGGVNSTGEGEKGVAGAGGKERYYYDDYGRKRRVKPGKRKTPHLLVEDPASVELSSELQTELNRILQWAICYLRHADFNFERAGESSGVCPIFGLGGTAIRNLPGFSLERFLLYFAVDIVQNQRLELPSALVSHLLTFGLVSCREASDLLLECFAASGRIHFHLKFRESVLRAAEMLPDGVREEDLEDRTDLTALETYTIDPSDAKDFDDAVSIVVREADDPENPHGKDVVELYVHIADVSHYVRPHDLIDEEARFRATSVYLPTGVVPMLPTKLSNHLCSLVAGDVRLAVSTRLTFDSETMEIIEKRHFNSFIRVNANLSYEYVMERIREGKEPFASMHRLAQRLAEKHRRLDLETPERKLRFTPDGSGFDISLKHATDATRMIENFMVVTNEAVADTISEAKMPALYRIHPLPDRERVEKFSGMCSALGYDDLRIEVDWDALSRTHSGGKKPQSAGSDDLVSALLSGGKISLGGFGFPGAGVMNGAGAEKEGIEGEDEEENETIGGPLQPMNPADLKIFVDAFQKTLAGIKAKEEDLRNMLTDRLLSTLPRANYSPSNHGHFGLNSLSYCHFTSPIRRYPDVLVHRALKFIINREQGRDTPWEPPEAEEVSTMSEICNEQSQSAEDLERQMVDIALATRLFVEKELRQKIYRAMVSGLTPTSVFLNMDGFSEGRIPLSHLSGDRLTVDEFEARVIRRDEITGEETEVLRLGQRVGCTVYSVDVGEGRIELSLKR